MSLSERVQRMKITAASESLKVAGSVASLNRKWWMPQGGGAASPQFTMIRYYPYYFQSWKVIAPKTLGRTVKVILSSGVNGMSRSVGPATEWPASEELEVDGEEVISPRTSEAEAKQLAREYIEKFVMRRYRPSRTSNIEQEKFELIFVPYYVYASEGQPLHKATLIEGFTGAVGKVKDVLPLMHSIVGEEVVTRRQEKVE